jgi:hypothetical protein
MRQHIERLCQENEIRCWQDSTHPNAWSANAFREIHTPPIKGAVSYAVALHEIGHILGRYQHSRHVFIREDWAWRWARVHALIWTPAMERHAQWALDWYRQRAAWIDSKSGQNP